jgi:hypothetical protein
MGYFQPSTSSRSARSFGRSFGQRIARAAIVALHALEKVRARREQQQRFEPCRVRSGVLSHEVSIVATKRIDRQKSRLNRRGFQNRSHVVVDVLLSTSILAARPSRAITAFAWDNRRIICGD